MPVDPRTPVLIGYGQINQHEERPDIEPVDLMAAAAREAAGPGVLAAVDAIRVVNVLSAHYRDPGLLLGERIGADNPTTGYSGIGGNVPQSLVNRACLDIWHGRSGVVLIAGGETWRTRTRLHSRGANFGWTRQDDTVAMAPLDDDNIELAGPAEQRIGLDRPAYVYPLFEQSLRLAAGASMDDHRRQLGELWARFNAIAVNNPHAWSREPVGAEQISRPGPANRMISWPYPKLMNSNNMVDQGAALILTSVQRATELRIPADRWVFPHAGTDAHDTYAIAERAELHRSPAIRLAGARVLQLAGIGIDDLAYVDLYSCFPSAVEVAARELGLPIADPSRPLTVTGGLTFAGGPWSNYATHSIATMAEVLAADPGRHGLVTANGGYLTKHSLGVYSSEPPPTGYRWEDVQAAVDGEPTRQALVQWEGLGVVESWTTPFDRAGEPEKVLLSVRTAAGARTLALMADPVAAAQSVADDIGGAPVVVDPDGSATLQ